MGVAIKDILWGQKKYESWSFQGGFISSEWIYFNGGTPKKNKGILAIVPRKAVAEVSKIGNL